MLELRIKRGRRNVPLFDLPAHVGRAEAVEELSDAIEGLIAFVDDLCGDTDAEENDTEDSFVFSEMARSLMEGPGCEISDPSGSCDEDGINSGPMNCIDTGPGCPISDQGEDAGDEEDAAWIEWDGRGRHKVNAAGAECFAHNSSGQIVHEDDEDDDPDHGLDEGEPNFAKRRGSADHPNGPGCEISDPGDEHDGRETDEGARIPSYGDDQRAGPKPLMDAEDRALMVPHLKRIRRTRCDRLEYGGTKGGYRMVEYRLRESGEEPPIGA